MDSLGNAGSGLLTLVQISTMVGVGLTILVQTIAFVVFMTRMAFRIDKLEQDLSAMKQKSEADNFPTRLVKIETILEIIQRQQDDQLLKLEATHNATTRMHEQIALFLRKGEIS